MNTVRRIKRSLDGWRLYRIAREIRNGVRRGLASSQQEEYVSLQPSGPSRGNVLLSYILDPFLLRPGANIPNTHPIHTESLLMARTYLDLGYSVDVIHYLNQIFLPKKDYAILVDPRSNMQRLAPLLTPDCRKILHIDCTHVLFQNAAEANRLLALQQRRGATLSPRRFEWPNLGIEYADCAVCLGNESTVKTFQYANKPIYRVPVIALGHYPWPEGKDFEACRKRFLWFGSGGLVRKGLDLVLEAFAGMPDYHLTVCGPIHGDQDFEQAYHKELYETPNIETVGFVDTDGLRFRDICRNSVGIVYPSCSEGGGSGVITCMHAGLIPIVSYEASVDVHDFGMMLPDCSISQIQHSVQCIASLPGKQLEQMARDAWEHARANHTKEIYAKEYRKVIEKILRNEPDPGPNRLSNCQRTV